MQRYRYTIAALLIFGALLAWVLTQERGRVAQKGEIFSLSINQFTKLGVEQGGEKIVLEKRGEDWYLTEPVSGLANKDTVTGMVRAVAQVKPEVREDADVTDPQYGLGNPVMTVTFAGPRGKSTTIKVGTETAVGGRCFATVSGRPHLYLVPTTFKSSLDKEVDQLREKSLVASLKTEDVQKVTITRGEQTIIAEKTKKGDQDIWRLREPVDTKADRWSVQSVIDAVRDAQVQEFAELSEDVSKFGLDQPQAVVTLTLKDKKTVQVRLGKEIEKQVKKMFSDEMETKDLVYCQREGRPEIMLMESGLLKDVSKEVFNLRDKRIVELTKADVVGIRVQRKSGLSFEARKVGDEWALETPSGVKPDQNKIDNLLWDLQDLEATNFVEEQSEDLGQYGLTIPQTVIALTLKGQGQPLKISFGDRIKDTSDYYCLTSQSPQVYQVTSMALSGLPKGVDDLKAQSSSPDETD